jgi:8-oxo-dGTP pyrophosphatase MutT (NUDIX family)
MTNQPQHSPFPEEKAPLPLLYKLGYVWARLKRGMTLGTRIVALDAQGRVFLVRHSYTKGWHLPGGGVEIGETFLEGAIRELREEANIEPLEPLKLHGIFLNRFLSRRDHVAVYLLRQFRQESLPKPNWEIVESGFFATDALPQGTTRGTAARIAEIVRGEPAGPYW